MRPAHGPAIEIGNDLPSQLNVASGRSWSEVGQGPARTPDRSRTGRRAARPAGRRRSTSADQIAPVRISQLDARHRISNRQAVTELHRPASTLRRSRWSRHREAPLSQYCPRSCRRVGSSGHRFLSRPPPVSCRWNRARSSEISRVGRRRFGQRGRQRQGGFSGQQDRLAGLVDAEPGNHAERGCR